jgi:hypothetical protein
MAPRLKVRHRDAAMAFEALSIEGGLLSPEWLARVAHREAEHQTEADYRVPKGLTLRDELGRYWRMAQALWVDFQRAWVAEKATAAVTETFVTTLLRDCLGFASLGRIEPVVKSERTYPLGWAALEGRVPVVVVAPRGPEDPRRSALDDLSPGLGDAGRRRSAFGLAQEYLNAEDEALWAIASDGLTLRMCRDNASLTRPAWIEVDLARIFAEERYPDFSAFWLLAHETRFGREGQPASACPLEAWRNAGKEEGTRAREFLRDGVEEALVALGRGFLSHPGNNSLRRALQEGTLTRDALFQELLRLVYRLIFLLTAEERGLLHPDGVVEELKDRYAQGYSMRRLRDRAVRRSAHDRFGDLWEALKIVFRGVGSGEPRLGLPALGGLFAPSQCSNLNLARLENRWLLLAVFRLSWLRGDAGLARVNWRDMGPEELGSVYESLLELVPVIPADFRGFSFAVGDQTKGNARKTTGSYYTPDSLVQVLLDSALDPVIQAAVTEHPDDPVEALLGLTIVDPACGSGHFLLAAARRVALHVARHRAQGTPSPSEYRHALREVVGRCLYGVDLNPLAVELCRVALWMEAVEPGRPLSFLDAHIQEGNSLLGTTPELMAKGIPDAAWEPIEGDDKKVASALKKRNKKEREDMNATFEFAPGLEEGTLALTTRVQMLDAQPDDSLQGLAQKEAGWQSVLDSDQYRARRLAADAWCAAFVWRKQAGDLANLAPTHKEWERLRHDPAAASPALVEVVQRLVTEFRLFHWHLQFPQVFVKGGFDVVLGNPPWDTLSPDAKEFFSQYDATIRSQSKPEQEASIERLSQDTAVGQAWRDHRRHLFCLAQFIKESGRFSLFATGNLGKGDFNLYRMFVELAMRSTRENGWFAQVVPEGLYAGANSAALRQELFSHCQLQCVFGFENTRGVWFPGVHPMTKFAIYSARRCGQTTDFSVAFCIRSASDLRNALSGGGMRLRAELVREFSPDALGIMEFKSQRDIDLARKMYSKYPPLSASIEGTAHREYLRELESGHFQEALTEDRSMLPHYEGRMVAQYDHRAKGYRSGRARSAVWEDLPFTHPGKSIQPQWYVPRDKLPDRARERVDHYRVGFCDVTSPTTERSLVAAMLPPGCVAGDKVPTVWMDSPNPMLDLLVWLSVANSFVMDFLVRMKVSLKMSLTIVDSLPFPRLPATSPVAQRLVKGALELSCTGPEMNGLWEQMAAERVVPSRGIGGGIPGTCDPAERQLVAARLDAEVAHLYELTADELSYVLDSFTLLKKSEESADGEYRTKRLIMKFFEETRESTRTGTPDRTRLDPSLFDSRLAHAPREESMEKKRAN